mmetsp:Transcript_16064/g.23009  ORF Transcript_16064/g.23009 Transcript_16064/m.23009 type:complete len:355 (-) Transcript_16064:339-1403(-)
MSSSDSCPPVTIDSNNETKTTSKISSGTEHLPQKDEKKGTNDIKTEKDGVGTDGDSSSITKGQADGAIQSGTEKPLSKNQLKKRRRYEKAMEVKKRRKEQEKEAKRAKAIADGRDLDEERRLQAEREKSGEGHKRREELWLKRMKTADTSFKICIDCSFESEMQRKEIGSLAQQIRYCYSANKRSKNPVYFSVSSLSGETHKQLSNVAGFPDQWVGRAFDCSEKSLLEMHTDKSKLVYLTADSENILDHLDDSKTYIIGGIVDRNRLKGITIAKAKELGLETAKLPIGSYLEMFSTKVLTCNHMFEILLKYRENDNDWKKAMLDVLPSRKDIKEKDSDVKTTGSTEVIPTKVES